MADQPRFADTLLITPNVIHNLGVLSFKCALDSIINPTCHHAPAMAHAVTCSPSQAGPACYWCLTRSTASILLCSRIFASLIAGLALGVVGYAGWSGFLWYFLAHALVMVPCFKCMATCQRGCRVKRLLTDFAHYRLSSQLPRGADIHLSFPGCLPPRWGRCSDIKRGRT